MARDKDVKSMIVRVNSTMDKLEKLLEGKGYGHSMPDNVDPEVEKDRVSYKEGLVDGLCMQSWEKDIDGVTIDYVGGGEGKVLKDVLEEIGSVFGFDGKEQYERVKLVEKVEEANGKVEILNGEVKNGDAKVTDIKGEDVEVKDDDIDEAESKL